MKTKALLEAVGLVTEKSAGWRFEVSGAKGGAAAMFLFQ